MSNNPLKINAKRVATYLLLPGIIPRAKELGASGFGYLAYLIANVYQAVRILPADHPYLSPSHIGQYGLRDVVRTAADNIQFSRKNIDQIIVFGAILLGLLLLAIQFFVFLLMLLSGKAFANTGDAPFTSIFRTDKPEHDIAFMLLDHVFGIPDLFGSRVLAESGGPTAFHHGLHALFEFYNMALLLVGVLILLYYVFVVVIETAQTGVPFGARFSKIYAPLRLITAIALLVPLHYGFNGAQYITFYMAKIGSSFATNGWTLYNSALDNPIGATNESLVALAETPDLNGLYYYASVYHACREMYSIYVENGYGTSGNRAGIHIEPYVIVEGNAEDLASYTYESAKQAFRSANVEIVLGELDTKRHAQYTAGVRPYCGTMTVSLVAQHPQGYRFQGGRGGGGGGGAGGARGGVRTIEQAYYDLVIQLLYSTNHTFAAVGERAARVYVPGSNITEGGERNTCHRQEDLEDGETCRNTTFPSATVFVADMDKFRQNIETGVRNGVRDVQQNLELGLTEEQLKYGWGGAGMWYNTVADINGIVTSTIYAAPSGKKYPEVMEYVRTQKLQSDRSHLQCETFDLNLADNKEIEFKTPYDRAIAMATNEMYKYWACSGGTVETAVPKSLTGNIVLDTISVVFGINGLFQLREATMRDEATGMPRTHPLAALTAIGRALVENSVRSMAMAIGASGFGGILEMLGNAAGPGLQSFSGMFVSIATIGLTAGFILYYILPFLPFMFFFFAVATWIKTVFEAAVGAPLWALAHLRIDGDGFSGQAASQGYFILLEIMLRPIVILFGLIGGMAAFGAMVAALNEIFDFVVVNIVGNSGSSIDTPDGFEPIRLSSLDQFFFTLVYTILVYMIANACFKMIDTIPKAFMRWIGSSVSTFNDNVGDPTANLVNYVGIAGNTIAPRILGGITQGSSTLGRAVGAVANTGNAAAKSGDGA